VKYIYTKKEKKCRKGEYRDSPERIRIYKILPIFSKGKVKLTSHTVRKKKNQANHGVKKL